MLQNVFFREKRMSSSIIIYSKQQCPYCVKAKGLLTRKGKTFTEIDVTRSEEALHDMLSQSGGRRTVPQIFINGTHVGGCDDLYALEAQGKLDAMLG